MVRSSSRRFCRRCQNGKTGTATFSNGWHHLLCTIYDVREFVKIKETCDRRTCSHHVLYSEKGCCEIRLCHVVSTHATTFYPFKISLCERDIIRTMTLRGYHMSSNREKALLEKGPFRNWNMDRFPDFGTTNPETGCLCAFNVLSRNVTGKHHQVLGRFPVELILFPRWYLAIASFTFIPSFLLKLLSRQAMISLLAGKTIALHGVMDPLGWIDAAQKIVQRIPESVEEHSLLFPPSLLATDNFEIPP